MLKISLSKTKSTKELPRIEADLQRQLQSMKYRSLSKLGKSAVNIANDEQKPMEVNRKNKPSV